MMRIITQFSHWRNNGIFPLQFIRIQTKSMMSPQRNALLRWQNATPDLKLIVSHMGGFQWARLRSIGCYVDMSAILPDYVRTFGIAKTNEILRAFGVDRLLFATDYPDNRVLQPDGIYNAYFDMLNQMDFTAEEAERIAYGNTKDLLG